MKPLAVDLCCGLGGWSEGLLTEGWDVVGFDIERHKYGHYQYPGQLVLQDILTLDGRQFRSKVSLIVASPPCQRYSYMAMPWSKAKALVPWYRDPAHPERLVELNALVNACFRIAQEAECPIVLENVKGAQPWIGRARWNYGSFALWGDVPALMPMTKAIKNNGGSWFNVAHNTRGLGNNARDALVAGIKQGGDWFNADQPSISRMCNSNSKARKARKAASAMIAKIPLPLSQYIARTFYP